MACNRFDPGCFSKWDITPDTPVKLGDEGTASNTTGAITSQSFQQQWLLDQLGNWQQFDQDDDGNGTWDLAQAFCKMETRP